MPDGHHLVTLSNWHHMDETINNVNQCCAPNLVALSTALMLLV